MKGRKESSWRSHQKSCMSKLNGKTKANYKEEKVDRVIKYVLVDR